MLLAQLTADATLPELAQHLLLAVGSGQWALAAVFVVVVLTALLKRIGAKLWKPLGSPWGAAAIALVSSVSLAVANAVIAGGAAAITWPLMLKAVLVALVAILPSAAEPISENDRRMLTDQGEQNHRERLLGGPQP